jgi:hypothetical protein
MCRRTSEMCCHGIVTVDLKRLTILNYFLSHRWRGNVPEFGRQNERNPGVSAIPQLVLCTPLAVHIYIIGDEGNNA